jgi:hypothetical protein
VNPTDFLGEFLVVRGFRQDARNEVSVIQRATDLEACTREKVNRREAYVVWSEAKEDRETGVLEKGIRDAEATDWY